ncbi:MAG: response regulator [Candidatus Moranbacteria bacterium]|jgi:CheY-like chemotaxis protein|nr:response regulator [Candidatus Moranbacteria bacterium]
MDEESRSMKKRVCIVDDDPDILMMYRMRFEQEGYDVSVATDGETGLTLIRSVRPDIVILDIHMPKMDGVSVLNELNHDSELAGIPVIVLSNNNSDQMFQKISDLGTVRYYIVKTLTTPRKVVDIVAEVLAEEPKTDE